MVKATFTLSVNELNESFIDRVRAFVQSQNAVVTIQVRPQAFPTKAEYFTDLDESIAQLSEEDQLVRFESLDFGLHLQTKRVNQL